MKRLILELGAGNDLYGMDYTKAAIRAVENALHHSSLTMFKSLDLDPARMEVRVTIGVQEPEKIGLEAIAQALPRGTPSVRAVFGGQYVQDPENGTTHVIASAAIEAYYPL